MGLRETKMLDTTDINVYPLFHTPGKKIHSLLPLQPGLSGLLSCLQAFLSLQQKAYDIHL